MLRQMIAQMLIIGFDGLVIDEAHPLTDLLTTIGLGGVLLFDQDLSSEKSFKNLISEIQIQALTQKLQALSAETPLFIALDYEGGEVDRLKNIPGCPATLTAEALARLSMADQEKAMASMASTVKNLGFNLNFAPVIDLPLQKGGYIGAAGRCFSANPEEMVDYARRFVQIFNQYQITCCYKHFPGHGSATGDSHLGFVDVTDSFDPLELQPYQQLIENKSLNAMIMTAHVINRHLDATGLPATLSRQILTDWLRKKMGYEGLIISDDLQMKAIANYYTLEQALKLTINAGADMVIFGNQLGQVSPVTLINIIERLVKQGDIPLARIEDAYARILSCKRCIY